MPPGSSDYARQLADARRQNRKMARRVRRAVDAEKYWTAKSRTRQHLQSFSARLIAAEHVSRRRRRKGREPLTEEQRLALAQRLRRWGPVEEPVHALEKPKRTPGEGRIVYAFGDLRTARQVLVRNALKPLANLHPEQYVLQGGRPRACRKVFDQLKKGESRWAVEFDIRDHFGSFDPVRFPPLIPIPDVLRHETLTKWEIGCQLSHGVYENVHARAFSAWGLPQGSVASSLVAEILLSDVLDELPASTSGLLYADNGLILARTREEAEASKVALRRALHRHVAGWFVLGHAHVLEVREGFDFLGYRYVANAGAVEVRPSEASWQEMRCKLGARIAEAGAHQGGRLEVAWRYVLAWAQSLKLWPDPGPYLLWMLAELDALDGRLRQRYGGAADREAPRLIERLGIEPASFLA